MKKNISLRNVILAMIPVLVAGAALAVFSLLPRNRQYLLEGAVEIASTTCYVKAGGVVESVLVENGQQVQAGDVMAVIDDQAVDRQIEQLLQVAEIKEAQLAQLKMPPELTAQLAARRAAEDNVTLWEESLAQARRELDAARKDLAVQQKLYRAGMIAQSELQKYEKAADLAQSEVKAAQAQLSAAQNNVEAVPLPDPGGQAVTAAQADLDLTLLQIRQLEDSREDYRIRAATDGVVISSGIEAGCTAAAGQGAFRVSNGARQYFVCYLPQEYLGQVAFGDELALFYQGSREEAARGTVTYIDLQSVYPPEDYQNQGNRNKRSVKIKAELTDGGPFAVGQELVLRLTAVRD